MGDCELLEVANKSAAGRAAGGSLVAGRQLVGGLAVADMLAVVNTAAGARFVGKTVVRSFARGYQAGFAVGWMV